MSTLRVNQIVNKLDDGSPSLDKGASVLGVGITAANINVSGILTATSFEGDGSNLTGLNVPTFGGVYSLRNIFGYGDCHKSRS